MVSVMKNIILLLCGFMVLGVNGCANKTYAVGSLEKQDIEFENHFVRKINQIQYLKNLTKIENRQYEDMHPDDIFSYQIRGDD